MVDAALNVRPDLTRQKLDVTIVGKIVEFRRAEGTYFTTIVSAAEDVFSSPVPFEVRSTRSLGRNTEVVTVNCRVGGYYRRSFETKPDQHGEIRRVTPVVVCLDAIED